MQAGFFWFPQNMCIIASFHGVRLGRPAGLAHIRTSIVRRGADCALADHCLGAMANAVACAQPPFVCVCFWAHLRASLSASCRVLVCARGTKGGGVSMTPLGAGPPPGRGAQGGGEEGRERCAGGLRAGHRRHERLRRGAGRGGSARARLPRRGRGGGRIGGGLCVAGCQVRASEPLGWWSPGGPRSCSGTRLLVMRDRIWGDIDPRFAADSTVLRSISTKGPGQFHRLGSCFDVLLMPAGCREDSSMSGVRSDIFRVCSDFGQSREEFDRIWTLRRVPPKATAFGQGWPCSVFRTSWGDVCQTVFSNIDRFQKCSLALVHQIWANSVNAGRCRTCPRFAPFRYLPILITFSVSS